MRELNLKPMPRFVVLFLVIAGLALTVAPVRAQGRFQDLRAKAQSRGRVRVIVTVDAGWRPEGLLRAAEATAQHRDLADTLDVVAHQIDVAGDKMLRRFDRLPQLVAEVSAQTLAQMEASPFVSSIHEDVARPLLLAESSPLVQAPTSWAWQRAGSTQTVAVLDTGIRAGHTFFGGRVVGEACFSTTSSANGSTTNCPSGADVQTGPGAAAPCTYTASCDHGTHVAGIAAGAGSFSGVGRGANLYAVQIFSRFSAAACGGSSSCTMAYDSDQIEGLNHIFAQRGSFNFASVNLSIGGGQFTANCDTQPQKPAIDQLRSVGIATVIAAGNDGRTNALSAPACISSSISVGSTTKADVVSSFSNAASFLHLWAPGSSIQSSTTATTTSFGFKSGTSMAAPHVAGAWAVLKQQKPSATVAEILSALQSTGQPITDTRSGGSVTKRRIEVFDALQALCPATPITPGGSAGGALAGSDCRAFRRNAYADSFTFNGSSGQAVAFLAQSAQFNPYLQLLDANGALVTEDDNGGGGTSARIPAGSGQLTLPSSGTYTLQVTSAGTSEVGAYTLSNGAPTATPTPTPPPTATPTPTPTVPGVGLAEFTSPPSGSTLTSSTVTFVWSAGTGVQEYWLSIGTTQDGSQLWGGSMGTATSRTVPGIPIDGRMIYAKIQSYKNGVWYGNYAYYSTAGGTPTPTPTPTAPPRETPTPTPTGAPTLTPTPTPTPGGSGIAELTSPVPGSAITTPTVTFAWSSGVGVAEYWLSIGTTLGGSQLWGGSAGTATSRTISGVPTDGRTIYARIQSFQNGVWQSSYATYNTGATPAPTATPTATPVSTATPTGVPSTTPTPTPTPVATSTPAPTATPSDIAQVTSPAPGSRLTSSTATFSWSAGTGVSEYWLSVGTTQDGSQLWGGSTGTARSQTISGLPTDGRTVYVRIQSNKNGAWPASYATYTTGP
jgi:subtilisin family serine protease